VCGDGTCSAGEDWQSCNSDCADIGLPECLGVCDDYLFFECIDSDSACAAACAAATPPARASFLGCAITVDCSTYAACLPRLAS